MTEYGRGYGSEPWHPEDPLFGDPGSYGGRPQQQPQWDGQQHAAPYPQSHQQGQQPYPQYPQDQQHQQQYGQQQDPYQQQTQPQQQYNGGWEASQGGGAPYDPYGQQPPVDPYSGSGPDYYGTQDAYPPPQPQHMRQQEAPPQDPQNVGPQHAGSQGTAPAGDDWRAESEAEDREQERVQAFFAGGDGDKDRPEEESESREERRSRRERRGKKNKRRSGLACLVVAAVLAGGIGVVGYFGYSFWAEHFGPAPDFEGEGSGEVQVEISPGSTVAEMGLTLKREGVVKSADAFTEAANDLKANNIQPGAYTLRKEMSAASAVKMMLDPKTRNGLTIPEGSRAVNVYKAIDKKLNLKDGTTKDVAEREAKNLGLPSWADSNPKIRDPLEGFLYPSTYSVNSKAKPQDVLKEMVARANQTYAKYDLEAKAKELNLKSPLQLLSVASLVNAEGVTHDDFRKMAEVVYNRLKPGNAETVGKIEFDSAYNYIKNQSKIDIPISAIRKFDHPYNTYFYAGLPPGPIGNPGEDALKATVNPTHDGWYYFISIDGKTTQFTKTYAEHDKLVREFNKQRQKG